MKNYWLIQGIMIPGNGGKSKMYQAIIYQENLGDGQMYHQVYGYLDIVNFKITPEKIQFETVECENITKNASSFKFDFNVIAGNVWSGIFDCENGYCGTTNCVVVQVDETFFQHKVERTYVKKN